MESVIAVFRQYESLPTFELDSQCSAKLDLVTYGPAYATTPDLLTPQNPQIAAGEKPKIDMEDSPSGDLLLATPARTSAGLSKNVLTERG